MNDDGDVIDASIFHHLSEESNLGRFTTTVTAPTSPAAVAVQNSQRSFFSGNTVTIPPKRDSSSHRINNTPKRLRGEKMFTINSQKGKSNRYDTVKIENENDLVTELQNNNVSFKNTTTSRASKNQQFKFSNSVKSQNNRPDHKPLGT